MSGDDATTEPQAQATSKTVEPKPHAKRRPGISEGILLALGSGVAYSVAYFYESAFADYYGYPHYFIEVTFISVLVCLATMAFTLGMAYHVFMSLGAMIPMRLLRIVVINRTFFYLLTTGVFYAFGWYLMWRLDSKWLGLALLIIGGTFSFLFLQPKVRAFRNAPPELSFLERLEHADAALAAEHDDSPIIADNVSRTLIKHPEVGEFFSAVYGLVLLMLLFWTVASIGGSIAASTQGRFLVSQDSVPLVVLRRYGDNFVVAPFNRNRSIVYRRYKLVPVSQSSSLWVSTYLGKLRAVPIPKRH